MRNIREAISGLWENRSRSLLSAMGITVAAIAIVLLVSIAIGVQKDIRSQVEDLGVNTLVVMPGKVGFGQFNPNIGGQSYLKEAQLPALRAVPGVVRACPMTFVGGGIRAGKKEAAPFIIATTADWFPMRPMSMRSGKVFSDASTADRIAVIGSIASDELFGEGVDSVGKRVNINGNEFTIVGVTVDKKMEQSLFSMGGMQNVVYIPYHAQKAISENQQTDRLMIQSRSDYDPKLLVPELNRAMAKQLDEVQFSILTQEDLLNLVFKVMSILTWLLVGLTSIALFVGGIGITAVMMMSVAERTREIGIRKTVGARRSDIFIQFMFESILLALFGGSVGLAFSAIVAYFLKEYTPIKPEINLTVILLCFGTCMFVGFVSGMIPAVRASRKDPVDAMRQE